MVGIIAVVMLLLSAASSDEIAPVQVDAALGEQVRIGPVRVRPLSVIEDSRCPKDAKCARPGRIVVRTEVREPSARKTRDFEIGQWRQVEQGGALVLTYATPPPRADGGTEAEAYRFTFKFER